VASRVEAYALAISIHPPITWCFGEIPPSKNGRFNVSRWFHHDVGIYVDYRNIIFSYIILNALRKSLQFKNIQEYSRIPRPYKFPRIVEKTKLLVYSCILLGA
jgi:hypothetical protein